jgi:hypothetical protein
MRALTLFPSSVVGDSARGKRLNAGNAGNGKNPTFANSANMGHPKPREGGAAADDKIKGENG